MCKSQAEGGQRCYGHSADQLNKAMAVLANAEPGSVEHKEATKKCNDALIALASTTRGAEELGDRILETTDPAERAKLITIQAKGQEARKRSAKIRAAYLEKSAQEASLAEMGLKKIQTTDPSANFLTTTLILNAEDLPQDGPNNTPALQIHDANGELVTYGHHRNGQLWSPDANTRAHMSKSPGRLELTHFVAGSPTDLEGQPAQLVYVDGQLSSHRHFDLGVRAEGRDGAPHFMGFHPNGSVRWTMTSDGTRQDFPDNGVFTYDDPRTEGAQVSVFSYHDRTTTIRTRNGKTHDGAYGEPAVTVVRRDGTLQSVSHYKDGVPTANDDGIYHADYDLDGKMWTVGRHDPNKSIPESLATDDSSELDTLHFLILTNQEDKTTPVEVVTDSDGFTSARVVEITDKSATDNSFPKSSVGFWNLQYDQEFGLSSWKRYSTRDEALAALAPVKEGTS